MAFKKTYSAQTALKTCADHEHEELDMYCRTCKKPICTVCVKTKHMNHDWDRMKKIAKELRADSIRRKLEIESVLKSINLGTTDILDRISSDNEENFTRNMSDLESTRKSMHEIVDSAIDAMKKKCQTQRDKTNKAVKYKKEEMAPIQDRLKFLLGHAEEAAADYTDYDVIEFHDELNGLLILLGTITVVPPDLREETVYKKETLDKAVIISMLGSVDIFTNSPSSMSVVSVSRFSCGKNPVNSICPISRDRAWIHCMKSTFNTLIDIHGGQKKSVELCRCYNFDISKDGTLFACDNLDTLTVNSLDKLGHKGSLFSTAPLLPTFISLTRSGDLLVSLVDENMYERTSSSRRLIRRVTKAGTKIREYEFDNDGKTPLFSKPIKSIEKNNGDVCIINHFLDKTGKHVGILYGFDNCGVLKFKYNGKDKLFYPIDICCDMICRILVNDCRNKCVHFLDSEGNFVQYLLTQQILNFKPYAIALCENRLWISNAEDGQVNVYNLLTH